MQDREGVMARPSAVARPPLRIAFVAPERFPLPPREEFATAIEFLMQEMGEVLGEHHSVTVFSVAPSSPTEGSGTAVSTMGWQGKRPPHGPTPSGDKPPNYVWLGRGNGIAYSYTPVTFFDTNVLPVLFRIARRTLRRDIQYWQSTLYYGLYALQTALKIRRGGFDVVHLFNILQFAPAIRWLAPRSKIVFHVAWHGLSKDRDYYGYSVLQTGLAERCLRDVDAIVACSDYLLRGIRERFPGHAHKLTRVYNGVRARPTEPDDRVIRLSGCKVIFAGRIVPEKGLHTLLKAMRLVFDRLPEARLQVVGISWRPGAEFSAYEREIRALMDGFEDRIEFLGWQSRADFPVVLAEADVYAFPSVWEEPFSMALLEAMSAGLPVVATSTGGTAELIRDGENGFLVPPDDPAALAEDIAKLLIDADLRQQMGERGRVLVQERYSWQCIVEELMAMYYRIVEFGGG